MDALQSPICTNLLLQRKFILEMNQRYLFNPRHSHSVNSKAYWLSVKCIVNLCIPV
jgi:hypothetical protein